MSDPDNEIERAVYQTPSNDDDLYDDYDDEEGFGRGPVFAIFAVIVLAAFVGVVWLAYQQGLSQGRQTAPPIITASSDPFKVEPEDPQGMAEPETTLTDNAIAGQPLDQVATITPSSEAPIEVPQTQTASEAPSTTPELRTTRPATTTSQPTATSPGGLVVPPPSSRVQNAEVGEDLQTASNIPAPSTQTQQPTSATTQPTQQQPTSQPASVQPAATTQGPPALSTGTPTLTGNNVVQVASFPNRVDADAAWARLQSRHGTIVGPYVQDVQAVDLGARGTWYRLRFGYFEGHSAAVTVCDQLKAAGQDCLVATR